MNELQTFTYNNTQVRTIEKNGEPWFVLKDVCDILGMTNSRMIAERLDNDEKGVSQIYTPGGKQEMTVISESGLYNVILRSDKPEAKPFRKWVTAEVLPSIRKTGAYMTVTNQLQTFTINKTELAIKEYKGQRVVTFKDVDTVHNRPNGTARRGFNKNRFIEGVDFFRRNSSEAKSEYGITAPNGLLLMTETGYLMLAKSFNDDLAWEVQRALVNGYFKSRELQTPELSQELANVVSDIKEIKQQLATLTVAKQGHETIAFLPTDNEFLKKRKSFISCMIADLTSIYGETNTKILSECYRAMKKYGINVQEIHDNMCTELNDWSLSVFETLCRDATSSRALMLAAAVLMDRSGYV